MKQQTTHLFSSASARQGRGEKRRTEKSDVVVLDDYIEVLDPVQAEGWVRERGGEDFHDDVPVGE
jgi:hypothetical protein